MVVSLLALAIGIVSATVYVRRTAAKRRADGWAYPVAERLRDGVSVLVGVLVLSAIFVWTWNAPSPTNAGYDTTTTTADFKCWIDQGTGETICSDDIHPSG